MPPTKLSAATPSLRLVLLLSLALLAAWLTACTGPALKPDAPAWHDARQMIVVTTAHWDANQGTLRAFEWTPQGWRQVLSAQPVSIGRAGSAWGSGLHPQQPSGADAPRKQEGDGRAPAGVFRIGTAFGYADRAPTALPYAAMDAGDYCIDVVQSSLYNSIVDAGTVGAAAIAGSTEPMRRDLHANGDQRYKLGFVIEHNAAAVAGDGSCIFAHLWKAPGEPTAGCTAMSEPVMLSLLAWLQPDRHPVFVLLPQPEYARVASAWRLPDVAFP